MPVTMLLIASTSSRTTTRIPSKVLGRSRERSATQAINGLSTQPRSNLSMRRAGPRSTTHSLVPIRVPMPLAQGTAQGTTASSSLPTVRKTGLSITPIRSRERAATIFVHRVSSASPGIPTARQTLVGRYLWVSRWRNRHGKCRVSCYIESGP